MSEEEDFGSLVPEQRVSGGRLFIQNGRDFYTKVMSNGVGVIVRGHKTAHIGFDKTPILPHRVSNRPITLPPHTVSRQFHLIESPGRPLNNAISHLLHSIVKSAAPELVTKTLLTTFTYLTTVLKHSNTIVKTREETISNVVTQKYRPTLDYTASATVKAESSSLAPEILASFTGPSNYFTDSLTTTYIYYNTFTVDSLPVILTSRETVTNVVTLPIYMSPTMTDLVMSNSRIYETETYYTTYTFSKTILKGDATSEVVTTKEIITQVVVTEALAPPSSTTAPMNTPLPQPGMQMDEITKTYLTTFTHLFTEIDDFGQLIIRSSTSVSSEVVTETVSHVDSSESVGPLPASILAIKMTAMPTFTGWIKKPSTMEPLGYITMRSPSTMLPIKSDIRFTEIKPSSTVSFPEPQTLEPVLIYATKTYYTTYTYFTTILADGTRTKPTVHSRTHIVSKVVTEALSTSFDAFYINQLKSSYLSKHSTMIDMTSSVREILPAKTYEPTLISGTLVTQKVSYPHWPKDHEELAMEVEGTTVNSIDGVEVPLKNKNKIQAEIHVSSASSEEHFDEVREPVNHIVNVLTLEASGSEESPTSAFISPSTTHEPIYSTGTVHTMNFKPAYPASGVKTSELHYDYGGGVGYVEKVTVKHPVPISSNPNNDHYMDGFYEKPVSHIPTPPLSASINPYPIQPLTTQKPKTKKPLNPYSTAAHELFPDIGPGPRPSHLPESPPPSLHEYSDEDKDYHDHIRYSSLLLNGGGRIPASSSVLVHRTGTMVVEPVSPSFSNPSQHLLNLVSQLADNAHWSDYDENNKDAEEEDIPAPNIYDIHTTFDSFSVPTSQLVPVVMHSPEVDFIPANVSKVVIDGYATNTVYNNDDMKIQIHHLSADDTLLEGSGSGSGEGPLFDEVVVGEGSGTGPTFIEVVTDEREDDHTANPDDIAGILESFVPITNAPIPPFPPRTRYTTSRRPYKNKKTKRPLTEADLLLLGSKEESGETSTKVYSLKVPNLHLLGEEGQDSFSEESDNVSDNKKDKENSEQDDISSESQERPQDDHVFEGPGPSKSSLPYSPIAPQLGPAPGSGPAASSTSGIDWKPLLKLGALGLGGIGATKLGPWFNTMATSFMKGSFLPVARNDTHRDRDRERDRPIFHRHPPPRDDRDRDRERRPIIEHSGPVFIPGERDRERDRMPPPDERIPRRPITSHAKDPSQRPVSLERDRGRDRDRDRDGGYLNPDYDFDPHKFSFKIKPLNNRMPDIFTEIRDNIDLGDMGHKHGEQHRSPSDLPEGKSEYGLNRFKTFMGADMHRPPKPGPSNRPPPFRGSGEVKKVPRPGGPIRGNRPGSPPDDMNDIPDFDHPPRKPKPDIPILRPVHSNEEIILPHRVRGDRPPPENFSHRPPPSFKRPFRPPPRNHHNSREEFPRPLHPFRSSEEILHLNPPPKSSESSYSRFHSEEMQGRPSRPPPRRPHPPPIHMSPPEGPGAFDLFPPHRHRPHSQEEPVPASGEQILQDQFGTRLPPPPPPNPNYDTTRNPDISFFPHNAGEGPFRPLASQEQNPSFPSPPPLEFDIDDMTRPEIHESDHELEHGEQGSFSNLPQTHPTTGVAGQPSDKFGNNDDDIDSFEFNPFQAEFENEFKKLSPSRKPTWPPLAGDNPLSYSYFDEINKNKQQSHPEFGVRLQENEIASSPSPTNQESVHDIHIIPPSPPLVYPPSTNPNQRPSTVYIVQTEELDGHSRPVTTPHPSIMSTGESYGVTTQYPKLIIKEVPTRPVAPYYRRSTTIPSSTTTPNPLLNSVQPQSSPTNRASIAKLFIRKFSSTTTPSPTTLYNDLTAEDENSSTPSRFVTWKTRFRPHFSTTPTPRNLTKPDPTDTLIDSWLISPTVNDLQDFLEDFKTKFNQPSGINSTADKSNIILPQKHSTTTTTTVKPKKTKVDDNLSYEDDDSLYDDDDIEDELDELSVGAASGETNSTGVKKIHPNHHPVHKPPIDAEHFFATGQGDFAQYYSGTEERETYVDPSNEEIVTSPYDNNSKNSSRFRSPSVTTFRPNRNHSHLIFASSTPLENEITELPGPTTYRPRFDVTFHNKMGTTSEEPLENNPTTFRGDIMKPTTFRPGPDDLPQIGSRLRPDPTRDLVTAGRFPSPSTRRPAPQEGMASFYDDADGLGQIKMKNKEIMKLPGKQKKPVNPLLSPDVLDALSDEEFGSSEQSKVAAAAPSRGSTSTTPKAAIEKSTTKKGDDIYGGDDELYSEEYDSTYDEDAYLEIPPALPNKNGYSPAAPTITKNSNEGKHYLPSSQHNQHNNQQQSPTGHSRRPGPLEIITSFFKRPGQQGRPPVGGPGGRIPFPNSSREPTRTMLPPPLSNEHRTELEYQANAFDPNKKTIPLNPSAEKGENVDDPIVLLPKDGQKDVPATYSPTRGQSGERPSLQPHFAGSSNNAVPTDGVNNGIRESTYIEQDSEYYEDGEYEEDEKNNVISPEHDQNGDGLHYTGPPIKFEPTRAPGNGNQNQNQRPPITIGGHLVNNGNLLKPPPTASQRRPPLQPPPSQGGRQPPSTIGRPNNIFSSLPATLQHVPPLGQNEPAPPRTEMEPPPIDSNRLKAQILELPSSGPIRYRPVNNNVHRPNLLRPDDELFKPTTKASKTVHTIASVDDLNKIIATNTFTAIIPTRGGNQNIEPSSTGSSTASTIADINGSEIHLEGSETSVAVPHSSTGTTIKMTSIVRYTGGKLETTEIKEIPKYTRGPNIIIPTRVSSISTSASTSTLVNNRLASGVSRKPPQIIRQSTTSSSTSSESSSSPNKVDNNNGVRVTVTMESSVSSTEADSGNKRPFIPTRIPSRATLPPWIRKTTEVTSETTTTTSSVSESISTIRMRYPITNPTSAEPTSSSKESTKQSIFDRLNRTDILRRTTVVPPKISAPATKPAKHAPSSSSHEHSRVSMEVSSKASSTENREKKPLLTFSKSTTFKPFRRPTLSFGSSSASKEKFTTSLINKVSTTLESPTAPPRNPSIFSGIFNTRRNLTMSGSTTSTGGTSVPVSGSSEYEYTDEEYDDEEDDFNLDGGVSSVSERPKTGANATSTENSRRVTTSSSTSVSTSTSVGKDSKVITSTSSEIAPTKVHFGNDNVRLSVSSNQKPKGFLNTMVLRGGMTRVPELPATTKYVTHSETVTKTLTETETTVVVTAGTPLTHTIMITRTLPPQTLISTIVGSVTLVNSIDVKPTTVRSTIFAQPTKEVYSFVDTSEIDDEENNVTGKDEDTYEKEIVHSGILNTGPGGHRPRPIPPRLQTPPPNIIPKVEPPHTTKEPKLHRTRPIQSILEQGCPDNCTQNNNQACRSYANGTKFKCDCKPGYARLKRKFPCRPAYTYELSLAINHMDGMSFDFKDLQNSASTAYTDFMLASKDAIDKAFLSTDIKRQFQGAEIMKLRPVNSINEKLSSAEPKVYVDFLVQLTANVTEDRIRNHFIRTLKSSNFSIGRTGVSSTKNMSDFGARDFNECTFSDYNDCSANADCINIRGSYSCRCKAGFRDKSPKKHRPGRECFEMLGCPECNYKGHCRINPYGEPFCECFRWFGGSKCHINLKILLFAIMGVVAILFIFVLLCSVLVCRRTKIRRERPGSGRFMRYRSPTSQATLDRAAIMNDSASSDGRQSPPRMMNVHSFTPDSLLQMDGLHDPKHGIRNDSLIGPDNVHLMNFSLRNVVMDQDRSLTVVIPRAKIRPPSRPPSIHATLGPDVNAELASNERKLINYLDHSPYPPAPYPSARPPPTNGSRQSTIRRHDSKQFRKLSLQEQRKISSGALVSSGTEVSARGGMRRRSIGPEPEPTYSGYEKSFSDLRSITDTMRSPAQQQLFGTDTSRTSCYSHSCKPPSYCAYSESVGHTMGDKDGASTVYTTQGKLFRMAQDVNDTSSTSSSQ